MSLHEPFAADFAAVRPHRDAMHGAADDLATALRFSPEAMWREPANANTRPD